MRIWRIFRSPTTLLEPDINFQFSGLVVYRNNNNFLQLGRAHCDIDRNRTVSETESISIRSSTEPLLSNVIATSIASPSEVFLRLDRVGDNLDGFYSADGSSWTFTGLTIYP